MKSRRARSKRLRILHLWSLDDVRKAVPYLRSVLGSLREHWLEASNMQLQLDRAKKHPEAHQRTGLLTKAHLDDEAHRSQRKFEDALEELNKLDVFLLDAVKGLALIPFRRDDDLAWYVFDQFTPRGMIGWRYHNDPIEECRPLSLLEDPAANDPVSN